MEKSEGMINKIIIGVIAAVISGIILFSLGMNGNNEVSGENHRTTISLPPSPPPSSIGSWCCDTYGNRRCPLVSPLIIGATCFCPGQGYGIVCE